MKLDIEDVWGEETLERQNDFPQAREQSQSWVRPAGGVCVPLCESALRMCWNLDQLGVT